MDKMREAMIDQDGAVWEKIGGAWSLYKPAQSAAVPALTVWYGAMPESNGKSNWTAILVRDGDITSGITIACSEYPDRVRYESDRMRFLIGEINKEPFILDYDAEKHSGYVKAETAAVPVVGDVDKMAESISGMVMEWVTAASAHNGDWQSGLARIIRKRIERFQPATSITAAELDALRKDAEKWRDLCERAGVNPSGTISYAGPLEGAPEDWAAIAQGKGE